MNKKTSFYQHFTKPILFISVLLLLGGVYCYMHMQASLFPEVLFPRITIIADAGEQPVDRMMITVTKPLESAVKKVPGVTVVKSHTSRGSCVIDVFFNWGTDIYATKLQLESRINEIKPYLPEVVISAEALNQSLFPVYGYTLESKVHTAIEMRDVGNLIVRPVFARVKGISNVVLSGGKSKEFVIIPDPSKMSALGILPSTIKEAFAQTNFVTSNGNIDAYNRLYLTLTDARLDGIEDLKNVVVKNDGTRAIRVADIAKVEVQEQQEFVKINANGSEVVQIDLVKQQGIDLLTFAKDAEIKANEVRKLLPKGYELKTYYNQSAFVGESLHSVIETIYEGLILALIVMMVFLHSWRASLVVMITIPITLAFSILVVYLAGITINVMSLGAIAASIGLLIDDAIVVIEQIYRGHEDHPEASRFKVVKKSIRYLFPAMIASSLATIVIYLPFGLMSGLAGSFFRQLSTTMQITLIVSFLVTWIVLPTLHLVIGYKRPKYKNENAHTHTPEAALKKVYWITQLYSKPWLSGICVVILCASAWLASKQLTTGFLPDLDEGTVVLDYHSPPGTDIEETDRLCKEMEKIIMSNPHVTTYSRRTATDIGFESHPANFGDYLIQLNHNRTLTTEEVISELRDSIALHVPVVTIEFGQRITDLLGDLMSTPQPVEVKIFGSDYNVLQSLAAQAEELMSKVKGITDIDNGLVAAGPSLVYVPNVEKLSQFGISLSNFQEQMQAYTGGVPLSQSARMIEPSSSMSAMTTGLQIGTLQDGEQMRRILMRFTKLKDNSPQLLKQQLIFLPDGSTRPVSFFCSVDVIPGEIEQRREDLKSNIVLTARLDGRDLGSTMTELQHKFNAELHLPKGYTREFGGSYAQQQQSFLELFNILALAVLLILGVLMFLFKEWRISFAVLFISLMGICGCILALWITGIPLNVSSYTGIIMIVGIIAENSIFTIHQYRMNRKEGGAVVDSVNYSIALRIRPKLMTAIGAILALMPLALGLGRGAEMQQPLAVAVIGGFVVGIPLLLVVLPSLMILIYRKQK